MRDGPKRMGRPPATDGDDTRRRIIEAALKCFGQRGFEQATYREIADELDLSNRTIYHHFGTKVELYSVVCRHATVEVVGTLRGAVEGRDGLTEQLVSLIEAATEVNRERPWLASFFVDAPGEARRHPELADAVRGYQDEVAELFTELVRLAIERGDVVPESDVESVVGLLFGLVIGLAQVATITPPELHASMFRECERLIEGTLMPAKPKRAKVRRVTAS